MELLTKVTYRSAHILAGTKANQGQRNEHMMNYNGPTQLWLVWLVSSSGNFAGLEDVLSTKCSNVSSLQKVWPNNLSKN